MDFDKLDSLKVGSQIQSLAHGASRMNLRDQTDSSKSGKILLSLPQCLTTGIQTKKSFNKGQPEKYQIGIFLDEGVKNHLKVLLNKVKEEIVQSSTKKYQEGDLQNIDKVIWCPADGNCNILYVQVPAFELHDADTQKSDLKFSTKAFVNDESSKANIKDYVGKKCYAITDLAIDNVFLGAKPSLQVKLNKIIFLPSISTETNEEQISSFV